VDHSIMGQGHKLTVAGPIPYKLRFFHFENSLSHIMFRTVSHKSLP
jgi:hypothetical protein